ncbi:hypothetical protein SERLA73DRAFT_129880 [Serpula lacrymans var. lacrymans S7.3]|uniref:glutathione transferase n=2 Tax=Serpula lacrymans var. lacrymans TaxID=341189 RepID=F8PK85_SERL3|nr:uncharacterized protein SERLADRAFT_378072 [Serpula lacrymans var. lacrymans S7.9]EGO03539.1 hypothetical protein SERLA73DRAFT_129880 [Serpula lacrymans var. lacrymans S7.3]EGO29351.1 hypothetical protein SERLADRAFT_378072 [Serpula lacrymans var. lacrymans S7.9]
MASESTTPQPKVVVHHLNDSRSQRILWLLEELEVPYQVKRYNRTSNMTAPKELFAISPLGKSPVITDGDITLAESGAIVEYIINKYGRSQDKPPDSGKVHDMYFTHYSEGSFMPLLVQQLIFNIIPKRAPFFLRYLLSYIFNSITSQLVTPELKKHKNMIETHLSKTGEWFAGGDHPTAADYMMSFPLEALVSENPEMLGPKAAEFIKRVQSRPAYKRGLEKGGDYAYAKL